MSDRDKPLLVLASKSPRRTELLDRIGVPHEVVPADVDETADVPAEPEDHVRTLAERKALTVAAIRPEALVLGADTVVCLDGEIMGKPAGFDEACGMIRRLAASTHRVFTGIALAGPDGSGVDSACEETRVTFRTLGEEEIRRYAATGEPFDKAGAYGIQGYGATLVKRVDGCYFNVMGLPLVRLVRLLAARGIDYPFGPLEWK